MGMKFAPGESGTKICSCYLLKYRFYVRSIWLNSHLTLLQFPKIARGCMFPAIVAMQIAVTM